MGRVFRGFRGFRGHPGVGRRGRLHPSIVYLKFPEAHNFMAVRAAADIHVTPHGEQS